jgi:hypothetical protein
MYRPADEREIYRRALRGLMADPPLLRATLVFPVLFVLAPAVGVLATADATDGLDAFGMVRWILLGACASVLASALVTVPGRRPALLLRGLIATGLALGPALALWLGALTRACSGDCL